MDRLVYVAASGREQIMQAQAVAMHNLANINTPGFRADMMQFESKQAYGDGHPSRVFAVAKPARANFESGNIINTGNELDVAITGDGFIAVQGEAGKEAYTRKGDLRVSAEGILVTGDNQPVIGNGGPIAIPPAEKIEIASDGTISIRPVGQGAEGLAQLDRIKLVNPDLDKMVKGADGLFYFGNQEVAPVDIDVKLTAGSLEESNVDAIASLIQIMDLTRQYEVQVRMMKTAEEQDEGASQLMSVS